MMAVFGAVYRDSVGGEDFVLLGLRNRVVVLRNTDGVVVEPSYAEFDANFVDLDIHDHVSFCCPVHDTHTEFLHQGCILR